MAPRHASSTAGVPGVPGVPGAPGGTAGAALGVLPGRRLYVIGAGTPRERLQHLARTAAASGDFAEVLLVHDCAERVDLGCDDCPFGIHENAAPAGAAGAVCLRQYRAARADAPGLAPVADVLTSGRLAAALGTPALDPRRDRVLVCASPGVAGQVREILSVWGFTQTERGVPGHFALDCADWCRASTQGHRTAPAFAAEPATDAHAES